MLDQQVKPWTVSDAADTYDVGRWGAGYFSVDQTGHLHVHPTKDPQRSIDLKELIDSLQLRGIDLPILVRFADVLKHRLGEIHSAFSQAMKEHQFKGNYFCVYPIKVNQQRQVVEEVLSSAGHYISGSRPARSPSCWRSWRWPITKRRSFATVSRMKSIIEMAMLARRSAAA